MVKVAELPQFHSVETYCRIKEFLKYYKIPKLKSGSLKGSFRVPAKSAKIKVV